MASMLQNMGRIGVLTHFGRSSASKQPKPPPATESIESGKIQGIYALSKKLRMDNSFVTRILKLTFLAPDITMAILKGKEPSGLSLTKLLRPFPDDWDEQRKMMGLRSPTCFQNLQNLRNR